MRSRGSSSFSSTTALTKKRKQQIAKAYEQYTYWLERYMVLAVFTADPIRLKNIANARLGMSAEIQPRLDTDEHRRSRVVGMTSHFRGTEGANGSASLKMAFKGGRDRRERQRVWNWPPGIVDFELLTAYLYTVRLDRLVARGLMKDKDGRAVTRQTYDLHLDLAQGTRAFFISRFTNSSPIGGFNDSSLSLIFGESFHWVCTKVLGRTMPEWRPRGERNEAWAAFYGLLSAHAIRTLYATYWLGIVGHHGPERRTPDMGVQRLTGIEIAADGTDDTEEVLRAEYTCVPAVLAAKKYYPPDDWEHPGAHNAYMFRVALLESIDWELETKVPKPPTRGVRESFAPACRHRRDVDTDRLGSRAGLASGGAMPFDPAPLSSSE